MTYHRFGGLLVMALASSLRATSAAAQQEALAETASVAQRGDGVGLAPSGISLGAYRLYVTAAGSVTYDDNLYNRRSPDVSDGYFRLAPRAELRSSWQRHSLTINADGDFRRYFDTHSENSDQYGVSANGRYDIASNVKLNATGTVARRIEPRGTAGDILIAGGPTTYVQKAASLKLTALPGRFLFGLKGDIAQFRYDAAHTPDGRIDLSFRDYRSMSAGGRAGYELSSGVYAFGEASFNSARYPRARTLGRGSNGSSLGGGVHFDASQLIGGDIAISYIKQDFSSPLFANVSGLGYSAQVFWNVTSLLSLQLAAARSVQRAPIREAAGIDQNEVFVTADYELLRTLLLNAKVDYVRSSFRGIGRDENRFVETITARYNLNRFVDLTALVELRQQRSTVPDRDYGGHAVRLGLTAKY